MVLSNEPTSGSALETNELIKERAGTVFLPEEKERQFLREASRPSRVGHATYAPELVGNVGSMLDQ